MPGRDSQPSSWSFGWREVVVVVFVLFLASGVLLPRVQQSVNMHRMLLCKNNLKQLGTALHAYHQQYDVFPPGAARGGSRHDRSVYSWETLLLPFIDRGKAYQTLRPNSPLSLRQALEDEAPRAVALMRIPRFECPKDPESSLRNADRPLATRERRYEAATSNYVGSTGVNRRYGLGVFYLHSKVRVDDITDGTGNTFLLGERASGDLAETGRHGASVWVGTTGTTSESSLPTDAESTLYGTTRVKVHTGEKLIGQEGYAPWLGFSSRHYRNQCQFLLADGSVRRISPDIDSRMGIEPADVTSWGVYQWLSCRNDGEFPLRERNAARLRDFERRNRGPFGPSVR